MIAGFILIAVSLRMWYVYYRNSRRPRMEVRIQEIVLRYIRQDKKQQSRPYPHALVKYNYDGKNYESHVFLKSSGKSPGDWIEICIDPARPEIADIYLPVKEKRAIFIVFLIGALLVAGSWWIIAHFELW